MADFKVKTYPIYPNNNGASCHKGDMHSMNCNFFLNNNVENDCKIL